MNFKYSIGTGKDYKDNPLKTLLKDGFVTMCYRDQTRVCSSGCAAFNLYDGVIELKCMPQLTEYGQVAESIIPTLDEVNELFKLLNKEGSREFYLHYKSNGWMIGKNKVKDWKALAEKWNSDRKKSYKTGNQELSDVQKEMIRKGEGVVSKAGFFRRLG